MQCVSEANKDEKQLCQGYTFSRNSQIAVLAVGRIQILWSYLNTVYSVARESFHHYPSGPLLNRRSDLYSWQNTDLSLG